jgi:hypothetical protein
MAGKPEDKGLSNLIFRISVFERRLLALPSATLCIQCQEETEREGATSRPVMAGKPEDKVCPI